MTSTTTAVELSSDQPASQAADVKQNDDTATRTTTTTLPQTKTVLTSSRSIPNESSDSTAPPNNDSVQTGNESNLPTTLPPTNDSGKAATERTSAEEDGGRSQSRSFIHTNDFLCKGVPVSTKV